jgi:hypothetical protein
MILPTRLDSYIICGAAGLGTVKGNNVIGFHCSGLQSCLSSCFREDYALFHLLSLISLGRAHEVVYNCPLCKERPTAIFTIRYDQFHCASCLAI